MGDGLEERREGREDGQAGGDDEEEAAYQQHLQGRPDDDDVRSIESTPLPPGENPGTGGQRRRRRDRLTSAICGLLDDYSMVSFLPLNITDEESLDHVLMHVDHAVQYGEDLDVRGADMDDDMGADGGE